MYFNAAKLLILASILLIVVAQRPKNPGPKRPQRQPPPRRPRPRPNKPSPKPEPLPWEYEISDYANHKCKRECRLRQRSMTCEYVFVVEHYEVLSRACYDCPFNQSHCSLPHCIAADGNHRSLKVVNRMMPGPAIEVCEGDRVKVTVVNRLGSSEVTSIHWHGQLQKETPFMDGVGLLTQCPIGYNSKFTYNFIAKEPGTHFWHSHSGPQRADGVFGPLIVRRPNRFFLEPNKGLYEHDLSEHVIIVNDWTGAAIADRFSRLTHIELAASRPEHMLVNGKGRSNEFTDSDGNIHHTPYAEFSVTPGQRYRFRLISNGIMNCPIQFSIDNHTMSIIASDGHPILPFVVDSLVINSGERYDFVLNADQTTVLRNYWIRLHGYNNCAPLKATQTAVLRYNGAPNVLPPEPTTWEDAIRDGTSLNSAIADTSEPRTRYEISDMFAATLHPDLHTVSEETPDVKLYLAIEFHGIENDVAHHDQHYPYNATYNSHSRFFSPHLNWISNMMPPAPPLTQPDDIPKGQFCNAETVTKDCKQEWCACTHHYKIPKDALVELVIVDEGILSHAYHPMHLHGHAFSVVAMGRIGEKTSLEEVKALDAEDKIERRTGQVPIKDTVIIPDGGYTIIRFRADNPGFWFFHCHVEFHAEAGMAMVFQVGEETDFPRTPRNFKKC